MNLEQMVQKYMITTAQANAGINKPLWENMQQYAKKYKAEIVVLPTSGRSIYDDDYHESLQPYLRFGSFNINNNLRVSDFQLRPQMINPLTGIKRFARGDASYIFASPKQALQYVANSNDKLPKAVMTTGAVTKPNYNTNNRIGNIAVRDHTYGFVMVELENNSTFHFRHVKALKNGNFSDALSSPKDSVAMIVGDLHPYYTDPKHEKVTMQQIKHFKPESVFLHDSFNALSISHHLLGHHIESYKTFDKQGLSLTKELQYTAKAINKYAKAVNNGTVYLVQSNHDEHLYRYLDEGRFVGDKGNELEGAQLFAEALQGNNPLEVGLRKYGLMDNVVFLTDSTDMKIRGYQLAHHGHLGVHGGRASPKSLEEANGKSITGHTHTPFINRETYCVGTSTKMRVGYNRGYSGWVNTNAVLYDNGTVQLLNTINGKWKI